MSIWTWIFGSKNANGQEAKKKPRAWTDEDLRRAAAARTIKHELKQRRIELQGRDLDLEERKLNVAEAKLKAQEAKYLSEANDYDVEPEEDDDTDDDKDDFDEFAKQAFKEVMKRGRIANSGGSEDNLGYEPQVKGA